jgi:hypothetical protein
MNPKPAGYSGTPLARKLGIVEGARVVTRNAPDGYAGLLEPVPAGASFGKKVSQKTDIVHIFSSR